MLSSPCSALIARMTAPSCACWRQLPVPLGCALLEADKRERFSCTSPERKKIEIQERIYNQHVRLLPPSLWLVCASKVYSGRGSRHFLWNDFTHWPSAWRSSEALAHLRTALLASFTRRQFSGGMKIGTTILP